MEDVDVIGYLPLVRTQARLAGVRLRGQVAYDDLYQYGCIGLMKAITTFNESRHVAFLVYARGRIISQMIDGFRRETHFRARCRLGVFMDQFEPSILNVKTGESPERLNAAIDLAAAIRTLNKREARIMSGYLSGFTGLELAAAERISPGRISQIIRKGLSKMQRSGI